MRRTVNRGELQANLFDEIKRSCCNQLISFYQMLNWLKKSVEKITLCITHWISVSNNIAHRKPRVHTNTHTNPVEYSLFVLSKFHQVHRQWAMWPQTLSTWNRNFTAFSRQMWRYTLKFIMKENWNEGARHECVEIFHVILHPPFDWKKKKIMTIESLCENKILHTLTIRYVRISTEWIVVSYLSHFDDVDVDVNNKRRQSFPMWWDSTHIFVCCVRERWNKLNSFAGCHKIYCLYFVSLCAM